MSIRHPLELLLVLVMVASCARGTQSTRIVVAATTSVDDTGLLDVLTREFMRAHPEIELAPVSVGTGQAIELGRRGDADALITHDSIAEVQLVAEGVASERRSLMHNDFVVAGPAEDPAHARGGVAVDAFRAIAGAQAPFISRGDDSGTHRRERKVWQNAGLNPQSGGWYIEAGVGQGDALLMASQRHAYILTDRATYLSFRARLDLPVLVEGDTALVNRYAVTVINGERRAAAEVFASWLTLPETQRTIADFGRAQFGEPLFNPSADTTPTR